MKNGFIGLPTYATCIYTISAVCPPGFEQMVLTDGFLLRNNSTVGAEILVTHTHIMQGHNHNYSHNHGAYTTGTASNAFQTHGSVDNHPVGRNGVGHTHGVTPYTDSRDTDGTSYTTSTTSTSSGILPPFVDVLYCEKRI